jgi:hypothetical protein
MQLTAKLVQLLPIESGTGRNGEWKKQTIIVEIPGQYPRKLAISVWGERIHSLPQEPGTSLVIDFDVESREYNGRWFTDVKAWRIEALAAPSTSSQPQPAGYPGQPAAYQGQPTAYPPIPPEVAPPVFPPLPPDQQNNADDLPF